MELQPAASRRADDRAAAISTDELDRRVGQVRARLSFLASAEGWLRVVGLLSILVAAGLILDYFANLPRAARAVVLAIHGLVAAVATWRWVIRPLKSLPHRDALALFVERRQPQLRSRLISALQLARAGESESDTRAFVDRLVADAGNATSDLDPAGLVPADRLGRVARNVVPMLIAVAVAGFAGGPLTVSLLRRAVLSDVEIPRRTRLVEVTGEQTVGRGDDVTIAAKAEGVIPKSGQLVVRHGTGRVQTLPLDSVAGQAGRYERVLANVPATFSYRLRVNDAESPEFRITVLPRPVVTNLVLTQELPAYTGLGSRALEPGGLKLLRGSRLRIRGNASQALAKAVARLGGFDAPKDASLDPADPGAFGLDLAADDPRLTSFSIELVDRNGITSRDPAVYAIEVVADQPPQVRIVLPARREELVTSRGTMLVAFEAKDDFGLAALRLRHQAAGNTSGPPATIELDLGSERTNVVRRRFELKLGTMKPPPSEGDFTEFWAEALDGNNLDGPGLGRSERYLLRVVTEAEKRLDLLTRAGDAIGRLGDVVQGQERLNETLGRVILAKPTP